MPTWRRRPIRTPTPAALHDALPQGAGRAISTAIPTRLTEMDALVAYLQMLGTLVDFIDLRAAPEIAEVTAMEPTTRMRHFADSWGLLAMAALLRRRRRLAPSGRAPARNDDAADMPLR